MKQKIVRVAMQHLNTNLVPLLNASAMVLN